MKTWCTMYPLWNHVIYCDYCRPTVNIGKINIPCPNLHADWCWIVSILVDMWLYCMITVYTWWGTPYSCFVHIWKQRWWQRQCCTPVSSDLSSAIQSVGHCRFKRRREACCDVKMYALRWLSVFAAQWQLMFNQIWHCTDSDSPKDQSYRLLHTLGCKAISSCHRASGKRSNL
jgi:hypothetical protein